MDMSWFEREKRKRNLADGYKETKGLKDGHCNRYACQAPLAGQPQSWMRDHETQTDSKLYYCLKCTMAFNESAMRFQPDMPRRCTMEPMQQENKP